MTFSTTKSKRFCDCGVTERLLYTGFLTIISIAYMMALLYLYTSHEGHDGKPGLSIEDIVETYYGNRSGTRLEAAIRGPMAAYIDLDDRHEVVAWLQSGAPEESFQPLIQPILEKSCLTCHAPASGLNIADLSTYSGVLEVAQVDTGESLHTLIKLSHIHLFGIALVAFVIGHIFRHVSLWPWLKRTLIVVPFVAIFADIAAWFLTKWDPVYAYTVVIAGGLLGAAWGAQILISLYQMWIPRSE